MKLKTYQKYLRPKLFDAGTGFWDGTERVNDVTFDVDWDYYDQTGKLRGLPSDVNPKAVVGGMEGCEVTKLDYSDTAMPKGAGGYVRLSNPAGKKNKVFSNEIPMTEKLEASVIDKGIPMLDHTQVIRIIRNDEKVLGLLCLNSQESSPGSWTGR